MSGPTTPGSDPSSADSNGGLSQLMAALQANAPQNDADPTSIILKTLSDAGITADDQRGIGNHGEEIPDAWIKAGCRTRMVRDPLNQQPFCGPTGDHHGVSEAAERSCDLCVPLRGPLPRHCTGPRMNNDCPRR